MFFLILCKQCNAKTNYICSFERGDKRCCNKPHKNKLFLKCILKCFIYFFTCSSARDIYLLTAPLHLTISCNRNMNTPDIPLIPRNLISSKLSLATVE